MGDDYIWCNYWIHYVCCWNALDHGFWLYAGNLIGDLIAGTKKYRSVKLNIIAYACFCLGATGSYIAYFANKLILLILVVIAAMTAPSLKYILLLIKKLSAGGSIVFVVTHDYELVCQVCTRVLHLDTDKMAENLQVNLENEGKIKSLFGLYQN